MLRLATDRQRLTDGSRQIPARKRAIPLQTRDLSRPDDLALRTLADLISAHAPYDGTFQLGVPGVCVVRTSRTGPHGVPAGTYGVKGLPAAVWGAKGAMLCLVAQGASVLLLGRDVHECDVARMIVRSVDLHGEAQVVRASPSMPFLGFVLELDRSRIAELAQKVYPHGSPKSPSSCGLHLDQATDGIVNAVARLLEVLAEPVDAELLAPLVIDEILIRLLRSPIGDRVAQIGTPHPELQRIAKAVYWIRDNFDQPMTVKELAKQAYMSVSSFHQHFKAVTSMSPLRYQRAVRLLEARRQMLFHRMDVDTASHYVGYVSASHFSREYTRFFGAPPTKDIARLRQDVPLLREESTAESKI